MTIEEKAKRYDESLGRAQAWIENRCMPSDTNRQGVLEDIFPELKESEDERIRKCIIDTLKGYHHLISTGGVTKEQMIAWLEKQGGKLSIRERYDKIKDSEWFKKTHEGMSVSEEPDDSYCREHCKGFQETGKCFADGACSAKIEAESVDKAKPKFNVGDWVVYYRNDSSREVLQVYDIRDGRYYFTDNCHFSWSVKECDEKSHLWTISDAKDGDILACGDKISCPFIFHNLTENLNPRSYCGVNTLFHFQYKPDDDDGYWCYSNEARPATNEECKLLFSKMKEAGYEWDSEKKELKIIDWSKHIKYEPNSPSIIETKSDWNEEDEKLTDVDHEYFSELLKNDNSNNIDDYAYQVAYCMSHDWIKETATWDDVQKACKLGAEWNEKCHKSAWSKEDDEFITAAICFIDSYNHDNGFVCNGIHKDDVSKWILSLKERMGGKL